MVERTAAGQQLYRWWSALAPACTASLAVSIDLWALLLNAWQRCSKTSGPSRLYALPVVLGQTYEAEFSPSTATEHRKRRGRYYTPEAIAQFMVEATLGSACGAPSRPPTVLDPSCGGGICLVLAYRYLLLHCRPPEGDAQLLDYLFGVDIDPNAVAVTRLALALAAIGSPQSPPFKGGKPQAGGSKDGPEAFSLQESHSKSCSPKVGGWGASLSGETSKLLCAPTFTNLSQTIRCGNALVRPAPGRAAIALDLTPYPLQKTQFDVVLGNPPYLDSETMTRHLPHWRTYCRGGSEASGARTSGFRPGGRRYQTAQGNWDLFCVFIERALELCREGGWHSFVVPNKLASAEYAAGARSLLGRCRLHHLRDYSRVKAFEAAVYPMVYVVQNSRDRSAGTFCYEVMATLTQPSETHRRCTSRVSSGGAWRLASRQSWVAQLQQCPKLGDAAAVTGAASVSEAYRLKPLIHEQPQPSNAFQVVNSGTIDPYCHHWGHKPLRYLGDRYPHPVVSKSALALAFPKRHQQAASPKLIVAGLTRELECVWDDAGALLAGKSTTLILLREAEQLGPVLLGLLNSALMTAYVKAIFGGNALQGGYLRIGPPQVRSLPLPGRGLDAALAREQLHQLVLQRRGLPHGASAAAQIEAAIDREVCELYGVSWRDVMP
ncbi:MAG: Eco57I restriction-modification methylase domain-containing protein [Elainellaceae cyanobacterium]